MPINYKEYPPNWKTEIRPAILERANNCCEFCGVENYAIGYRDLEGEFYKLSFIEDELEIRGNDMFCNILSNCYDKKGEPTKPIKIVLTIAHLDHDKLNHEINLERLKALCQKCHLGYDIKNHIQNRKYGRNHNNNLKLDL